MLSDGFKTCFVIGDDETASIAACARARLSNKPRSTAMCPRACGEGHAPLALCHVQLEARAGAEATRSAAMRTQLSNAVKSCQMSAGARRGATSAQPCRFERMDHHQIVGQPEILDRQSRRIDQASSREITLVNSPTRSA